MGNKDTQIDPKVEGTEPLEELKLPIIPESQHYEPENPLFTALNLRIDQLLGNKYGLEVTPRTAANAILDILRPSLQKQGIFIDTSALDTLIETLTASDDTDIEEKIKNIFGRYIENCQELIIFLVTLILSMRKRKEIKLAVQIEPDNITGLKKYFTDNGVDIDLTNIEDPNNLIDWIITYKVLLESCYKDDDHQLSIQKLIQTIKQLKSIKIFKAKEHLLRKIADKYKQKNIIINCITLENFARDITANQIGDDSIQDEVFKFLDEIKTRHLYGIYPEVIRSLDIGELRNFKK